MEILDLINPNLIFLDQQLSDKQDLFSFVAKQLAEQNIINNIDVVIDKLNIREEEGPTGTGDGIAIPHCVSETVLKPAITIVQLKNEMNWNTIDHKPVQWFFIITTPETTDNTHLIALSELATCLGNTQLVKALHKAQSINDVIAIFGWNKINKLNQQKVQEENINSEQKSSHYDVIGITACPTGIAHTYMAKEKLEEAAKAMHFTYKIETQGRAGNENILSSDDIEHAKVIILANDKALTGMGRFANKQVLQTSTKAAIYDGQKLIKDYLQGVNLTKIKTTKTNQEENNEFTLKNFAQVTKNLLGGVSRMLPFVVAGGIILGIGFLLDSGNSGGNFGISRGVAAWFTGLGKVVFSMMIPILGAYLCYSIVGPQGLLPGMVCGLLAAAPDMLYSNTNSGWHNLWGQFFPDITNFNSGFFGAIIGGYIVAFAVYGLQKGFSRFVKTFRGVRDIVLIPVLTTLCAGVLMFVLNIPLGYLNWGLGIGLEKISEYNLNIIVGVIIGVMMAIDMGGPINKAAYVFSTLTIDANQTAYAAIRSSNGGTIFMAASLLAGMAPPLAIALSTRIFKKYWLQKDIDGGNANWFLGICFITEGAIPYAASDPKRVIPSIMIGSAITGAISGGFGVTLAAPHGGIFVFPLLRIQDNGSNWFSITSQGSSIGISVLIAILAVIIGSLVGAVILGLWRMNDVKNGKIKLENI